QKLPWSFCLSVELWSMENPQLVWRVGITPTVESMLLDSPGNTGVGMSGRRLAEFWLKQAVGILFPGHCCPGAGAVQPAGATKPWGTKIVSPVGNPLKSPPTMACVGTVIVAVSARFWRNQSELK